MITSRDATDAAVRDQEIASQAETTREVTEINAGLERLQESNRSAEALAEMATE